MPPEKTGTSKEGIAIEVEQIIKDHQDYPSNWNPEDDHEYVQIKLSLTNNSEYSTNLKNINFRIKDSGGIIDCAMDRHASFSFYKTLSNEGSRVSGTMLFYVRRNYADDLTFLYDCAFDHIAIHL